MLKPLSIAALASALTFAPTNQTEAQFRYANTYFEAGLMGGTMNYSGELTKTIMDFKHMHLGVGAFVRYTLNQYFTVRAQFTVGSISGNDADSKNLANQIRNLHFKSMLFEGDLKAEFNLLGYHPGHEKKVSPYIFFGLGLFAFNPKARTFDQTPGVAGSYVELQPLHTEGQGDLFPQLKPYKKVQVSLPMGAGVKFAINSNINLGLEIGFRKTFTDYLDDVSGTYLYDPLAGEYVYDQYGGSAYKPDFYGNKSLRELMSDRTWEYIATERGESLATMDFNDQAVLDRYDQLVQARGSYLRGVNKSTDWYVFTAASISYNFIDSGLVGARKRRKSKQGCKSSRF